jgi:hypothetical protein
LVAGVAHEETIFIFQSSILVRKRGAARWLVLIDCKSAFSKIEWECSLDGNRVVWFVPVYVCHINLRWKRRFWGRHIVPHTSFILERPIPEKIYWWTNNGNKWCG